MLVLGIETSCDDTSIALLESGKELPKIHFHRSFSQEKILAPWGGVVPEIAARNHLEQISPILNKLFQEHSNILRKVDCLAVTQFPGLLGPLLTGLNLAKSLSLIFKKPILGVNHLYAHLEAVHLTHKLEYPYLGLLVSGGHSLILHVEGPYKMKILSSTIDDAAGEAFDKGGKLMNLPYPAGKWIDHWAQWGKIHPHLFPIGLKGKTNMSFSGVKTSLRVYLEKHPEITSPQENEQTEALEQYQSFYDLCASYQEAIVMALKEKCTQMQNLYPLPIVIGGGVACNSRLRKVFQNSFKEVYFVDPKYCTDNGAMIANYALRAPELMSSYPECLKLDAKSRFIDKKDFL